MRGGAWTTAEAAIGTGLPLDVVEPRLLALAVATGAQLRVADDGNVTYVFPAQLRRLLLARSWRLRLDAWLRKVWSVLFWIIRCSFGVVLVVLVALISLLVLLLGLALFWAEDDAANALLSVVGGGLELIVRIVVAVLTDQFWIGSPGRFSSGNEQPPPQRVAFLESVYSILFGDGDPNQALETRRWQRIGAFLRHRGGVVIAEDLAPLLDLACLPSATDSSQTALISEQADQGLLPVLLHFDGRPQVTDQGDLIYCFPSLRTAQRRVVLCCRPFAARGRFFASTRTTDCVHPCQPGAALDLWHLGCELVGVVAVAPALELAPVGSTCWHCLVWSWLFPSVIRPAPAALVRLAPCQCGHSSAQSLAPAMGGLGSTPS